VSRQAYATFAAAGIVEAALAMGGLGGPGGPAGTVPADGAGGTEFGELAVVGILHADAAREAAPLVRPAVPIGDAAGLTGEPAQGLRADHPQRAVLVALARRPTFPLLAGARAELSAGAGADHPLGALGMLLAASPGKAGAGATGPPGRAFGVLPAGGDAGER